MLTLSLALLCLIAAVAVFAMLAKSRSPRRSRKTFPPVVELAQTTAPSRLALKVTSLIARSPKNKQPGPSPAAIPFLGDLPTPDKAAPAGAAEVSARSAFSSGATQPLSPLPDTEDRFPRPVTATSTSAPPSAAEHHHPAPDSAVAKGDGHLGHTTERSVYELVTGPYAAPIVHGTQIRLPDSGDTDLDIVFRSTHPDAQPILEAGESAQEVRITGPDGRIGFTDRGDSIAFGPSAD